MLDLSSERNVQRLLLKKSGMAITYLAGVFLPMKEGERLPTVTALTEQSGYTRGTIQNARAQLENLGAITLVSHGHQGTVLAAKDISKLVAAVGKSYISGIMPMPYTKAYEGLATGIFNSITTHSELSADLAYMRGSRKRITAVMEGKYDFAVVSLFAAECAMHDGVALSIAHNFGRSSYLGGHVMLFRDANAVCIRPHMRVGVDHTSYDHEGLTRLLVGSVDVDYQYINYGQITSLLSEGAIDAALCNVDQLTDPSGFGRSDVYLGPETEKEVTAVLVTNAHSGISQALVKAYIHPEVVIRQQQEVKSGQRYPNY